MRLRIFLENEKYISDLCDQSRKPTSYKIFSSIADHKKIKGERLHKREN
jgi:hypothetical protein